MRKEDFCSMVREVRPQVQIFWFSDLDFALRAYRYNADPTRHGESLWAACVPEGRTPDGADKRFVNKNREVAFSQD